MNRGQLYFVLPPLLAAGISSLGIGVYLLVPQMPIPQEQAQASVAKPQQQTVTAPLETIIADNERWVLKKTEAQNATVETLATKIQDTYRNSSRELVVAIFANSGEKFELVYSQMYPHDVYHILLELGHSKSRDALKAQIINRNPPKQNVIKTYGDLEIAQPLPNIIGFYLDGIYEGHIEYDKPYGENGRKITGIYIPQTALGDLLVQRSENIGFFDYTAALHRALRKLYTHNSVDWEKITDDITAYQRKMCRPPPINENTLGV